MWVFGGSIISCYNVGTVLESYYTGGVVGDRRTGATVINCYFLSDNGVDAGIGSLRLRYRSHSSQNSS